MTHEEKQPSEVLREFLAYIEQCKSKYQAAHNAVGREDKRLQDLLHELEFSEDAKERNRVATKFQKSRRERRKHKDEVQKLQLIVDFFDNPNNKPTMNRMQQLLGNQRKQEEYLNSDREYKPRFKEEK